VITFKGRKAQIKLKNSSLTPLAPSPKGEGSDYLQGEKGADKVKEQQPHPPRPLSKGEGE